MNNYEIFKQLHSQKEHFLLGNVWNADSAQLFEQSGIQAIATSSSALANSLGYEDGENMPFSELLFMAEKIINRITIPFSVDIESGFSKIPSEIVEHIKQLHQIGVVGINIEDSMISGTREMIPASEFCKKLAFVKSELQKNKIEIFINIRTDPFLLSIPSPLEEILKRINVYQNEGANGIFVPCIENETDISKVVSSTNLPVNVMCMPKLPSFEKLSELGVKRISMGGSVYNALNKNLENRIQNILREKSFKSLFQDYKY